MKRAKVKCVTLRRTWIDAAGDVRERVYRLAGPLPAAFANRIEREAGRRLGRFMRDQFPGELVKVRSVREEKAEQLATVPRGEWTLDVLLAAEVVTGSVSR